ncbi:MAG: O-methyltransferase [Terracidiphilus sp.]
MQETWTQVDHYFGDHLLSADPAFEAVLHANREAGLPAIDLTPLQGKFLHLLARICGARRILEVGTLGGYSTLWLARALPDDGLIVTLERNPDHARVARANLQQAGALNRVDLRLGPAADALRDLVQARVAPFDLIFLDADKAGLPDYLDWSLKLARPGTVIVADNVVREGKILDAASNDADVQGVLRFTQRLAAEPRLSSTVLQTVGIKGYDGFALSVVVE